MAEDRKLVAKLAHVMQQVQYIQKRGHNKFHNYKYATEADVNEKVREELAKQNVIMLPSMKSHTMRETKTKSGNTEYIVCVDMEFKFVDGDTGEELSITMSGEGQDVGDKAIYKAISGAQKYALMKVFMIPTGDDPEDDGDHKQNEMKQQSKPESKPQEKPADKTQIASIQSAKKALGLTKDQLESVAKDHGYDLYALTAMQADNLIGVLADYKPQEAANA